MNYGSDSRARPSQKGFDNMKPLPDGAYQVKCIKAEYVEGNKDGRNFARCKCLCDVLSPAEHKGERCEVFGFAKEGDKAAIARLEDMLYCMGYIDLRTEYAMDVINSESGPVGMVFDIKVKTSDQGTTFTNFVRRVAEKVHGEQATPFDEPAAPEGDFLF